MCLIGKPVEQGLAETGVGEDARPLGEGQVGGHDDSGFFRPFGDDLEEQFGGNLRQWYVTQFIDDDQFHTRPAGQHAAQALLALCFDQLVDQRGGGNEAHSPSLAAGSDGKASGKMTLAGARFAHHQDWFGAFEIASLGQSADA